MKESFLFLFIVGTAVAGLVCCNFSVNKTPIWSITLDAGKESFEDKCDWSYDTASRTLAYTEPQRIVVGLHLQCMHPSTIIPITMHSLDRVLQVDAQTGRVLNRMEWKDISTHSNRAGDIWILPTHDGLFLLGVGPFLKLFSADFKEQRSRLLIKDAIGPEKYWTVQVAQMSPVSESSGPIMTVTLSMPFHMYPRVFQEGLSD